MNTHRALQYIKWNYGRWERISEEYDDDDLLQGAIAALMPDFEYPDWSHKTIGQFLDQVEEEDAGK